MMISKSLQGGIDALSGIFFIFLTQTRLTASTSSEETTIRNCHFPVISPLSPQERRAGRGSVGAVKQSVSPLSPRGSGNPLSPRGRGAGSVINEEKDRRLHSALRRTNFAAALNDSQVRMYMLQTRQANVYEFFEFFEKGRIWVASTSITA